MAVIPITGTAGNDNLSGTSGGDIFALRQGGDDTASGLEGDDVFYMETAFNALDAIDGGDGNDKVFLRGEYGSGVTFTATTMTNIETLRLGGPHQYWLTTHDATIAAGEWLVINAEDPGSDILIDGHLETDGHFKIFAGAADDTFYGGGRKDSFFLGEGGHDVAFGQGGHDRFYLGGAYNGDGLAGDAGFDRLILNGDYAGATLSGLGGQSGIEIVELRGGHDYNLTLVFDISDFGSVTTIDGSALGAGDTLTLNLTATNNASGNVVTGGAGDNSVTGSNVFDQIDGGDGNNSMKGGGGIDTLICRNGIDTLVYTGAAESHGTAHDVIAYINLDADKIDTEVAVTSAGTRSGSLSVGSFDADMGVNFSDYVGAVVFTATSGDLAAHVFLVIDANGNNTYDAGADYVMELVSHTGTITTDDFI